MVRHLFALHPSTALRARDLRSRVAGRLKIEGRDDGLPRQSRDLCASQNGHGLLLLDDETIPLLRTSWRATEEQILPSFCKGSGGFSGILVMKT